MMICGIKNETVREGCLASMVKFILPLISQERDRDVPFERSRFARKLSLAMRLWGSHAHVYTTWV